MKHCRLGYAYPCLPAIWLLHAMSVTALLKDQNFKIMLNKFTVYTRGNTKWVCYQPAADFFFFFFWPPPHTRRLTPGIRETTYRLVVALPLERSRVRMLEYLRKDCEAQRLPLPVGRQTDKNVSAFYKASDDILLMKTQRWVSKL